MSELSTVTAALALATTEMKDAKESFENIREETEQRVAAKEAEVDTFLDSAKGSQLLPMPLNSNCALLGSTDSERLKGWGTTGDISLSISHPFEKGFEGPYTAEQGDKNAYATDISSATSSTPYYFGRYNKGPRANRGGLSDGWQTLSNGRLLKITKQAGEAHRHYHSVVLTLPQSVKSTHIVMKGFIYTEFDTDIYFGRYDSTSKLTVPKGEWVPIDQNFSTSEVFNNLIFMNFRSEKYSEVYLALPSFYVEAREGNNMSFITRS